jgi:hypothetical protein
MPWLRAELLGKRKSRNDPSSGWIRPLVVSEIRVIVMLLSKNFQLTEDQIVGLMVCSATNVGEALVLPRCRKCPALMFGCPAPVRSPLDGCTVALPDYVYQAAKVPSKRRSPTSTPCAGSSSMIAVTYREQH